MSKLHSFAAAMFREVEENRWFDPRHLQSACRRVLGQDAEPQIALDGIAIGVCVSECVNCDRS